VIDVPQAAIDLAKRFEGFHRVPKFDPASRIRTSARQGTGRLATAISAIHSIRRSPRSKQMLIWRAI
jgi:hypothetical protein